MIDGLFCDTGTPYPRGARDIFDILREGISDKAEALDSFYLN